MIVGGLRHPHACGVAPWSPIGKPMSLALSKAPLGGIKIRQLLHPPHHLTPSPQRAGVRRSPEGVSQQTRAASSVCGLVSTPMVLIGIAVAALLYGIWLLRRFLKADADLHLLSKPPPEKGFFDGKVVWITGSSQGLGRQLAQYFSSNGAKLILSSRRKEKLKAIASSCQGKYSSQTVILPFDLTSDHEVLSKVAKSALVSFDGAGPDYIIHNAGASQHSLAAETNPKVVEEMFKLNAVGPITLTQALLPGLVERGKGHFVVIASMGSVVPAAGQSIYSGSKFGLRGYFEALRTEMADSPLKFTVCCPGPLAANPDDLGAPRPSFGSDGLIIDNIPPKTKGKRMDPGRAIELIATATRHNIPECWISGHPTLLVGYLLQFFPHLGWGVLDKFGPARAKAVMTGEGYSISTIIFGKAKHS